MQTNKKARFVNVRSQDQRLVALLMNEKFLEAIDAALPNMGYSDRSRFIRTAILEKLYMEGIDVPVVLSLPPCRTGKGGWRRLSEPKVEQFKARAALPV